MMQRYRTPLLVTAGVTALIALAYGIYWAALLLISHHPAFMPNAQRRADMFRRLTRNQGNPGQWKPRQGDHWIF